jgi:hypothetical protein
MYKHATPKRATLDPATHVIHVNVDIAERRQPGRNEGVSDAPHERVVKVGVECVPAIVAPVRSTSTDAACECVHVCDEKERGCCVRREGGKGTDALQQLRTYMGGVAAAMPGVGKDGMRRPFHSIQGDVAGKGARNVACGALTGAATV